MNVLERLLDVWRRWHARALPATGRWGEDRAAEFLRAAGYEILGRNVRFGRRLELDLVVTRGSTLVFVEVKTRASESFGRPIDAVKASKRRTMSRAAARYLRAMRYRPAYYRMDVIEVVGSPGANGTPVIRHTEGAFSMERRYTPPL